MRIVPNLSEITECPNCGSRDLMAIQNVSTWTQSKFCHQCGEEIREGNILDNAVIAIPYEESHIIKIDNETTARREQEEKDKFLFNLREEIDRLHYNIHDTHSMMLVNKLTDIFTQIADYIENH